MISRMCGWRRAWGVGVALCSVALVWGCGDDGGAGQGAPAAPLTAEDRCPVVLEALCERQVGCNARLLNEATTVEACVDEARVLCELEQATWTPSVEAGLATFSEANLRACQDALGALSCVELVAGVRPEICAEVFVGAAAVGESCYTDAECAGEALCASTTQCPGTCQAREDVEAPVDCALVGCDAGSYCEGNRCSPKLEEGALCREADACQDGLFCGKDANAPELRCRPLKGEGEPCFVRAACQEGLSCQGAQGATACRAEVGEGGTCGDTNACARGLICDPSAGACVPPLEEGASCVHPEDCAEGLYCWEFGSDDPERGACRAESKVGLGEGERCNPALDRCRLGLYCRIEGDEAGVGVCALLPGLGESCADFARNLNEQCREGACVRLDGDLVCAQLASEGEACTYDGACVSEVCVNGVCLPYDDVVCTYEDQAP